MLVSTLFTAWIVVASVSSAQVDKSDEKYDPKSSNEVNSNKKEVSSNERDESAEKDGSSEKDRSVEKDKSSEKDNSVEKDKSTEKLSSKESEEEVHDGVKNKDDKFTKTTTTTITPGSTLPPCAMCNFQNGGMFIGWSQACPGCIYRPPMCSALGACCIVQPNCPVSQYGLPCLPNTQLGLPMASSISLMNPLAPQHPLGLPMASRSSLLSLVAPQLPGTIPQITSGISTINITKSRTFYGPVGGLIQSSGFGTPRPLAHSMGLADNWLGVPRDVGFAGGLPEAGTSVQNSGMIHPVYQAPGLQSKIAPGPVGGFIQYSGLGTLDNMVGAPGSVGPVGGFIQSSGLGTLDNMVGAPGGVGAAGEIPTIRTVVQNNPLVHPVYQTPGLQLGGTMLGGYTVINPICPVTKEACAELGGTCIPLAEKCGGVYKQDEQLCGSNCKCCIRPNIKDCRDLDKNCLSWANAGYCESYVQVKTHCKVSCSMCTPKLEEVSPPVSSMYISNQCQDQIPNCKAVATESACMTHANMRKLCPKTCDVPCTKTQALTQPKGGVCNHLTRNTCNDVMNGHCIPLNEECGGWFKQDPSLCGSGNCKCCVKEECNVKLEDAKICKQLGGICIPATTKCKGSSYPICGSNACQCCVDNPSALGSCPQKQGCGIGGMCTLGGCREGYQITDGQCPGPDCHCCKLKAHTICSDKPCGNGGTCRETTCLPGEIRLKENCGKGSCVCCKPGSCNTKQSCGNGGKCRCTVCNNNEERIYGHCKGLDCICCKPKKAGAKKLRIAAVKPLSRQLSVAQLIGDLNIKNPIDLSKIHKNKELYAVKPKKDFWNPGSFVKLPPFRPPNDVKKFSMFPFIFKDGVSKCRPSKNNICQKKGGDCIPLDEPCNGKSSTKYCGKEETCQCCLTDVSFLPGGYDNFGYPVRPIDHLEEVDDNESVNPSVGLTDDTIESIQSTIEDNIQSRKEDDSQSVVVDNIESVTEGNGQSMAVDKAQPMTMDDVQSLVVDNIESIAKYNSQSMAVNNGQPMVVDDVQSMVVDNSQSMAQEDISSIEKANIKSIEINGFPDVTADASLASDNKAEDRVVNTPSINDNTPMNQEILVEIPSSYYVDYQDISNDPMESNYELNNIPEINMLDYYDSVNIPLGGIEHALNSKEHYDMTDISSMVNNNEKDIKDNNEALNENRASDLDPLQNSNDNVDYLNDMLSMDLDPSLDIKEYYDDINNGDSVSAKSLMNLKDYYEEGNNIPTMDYYNPVDGNPFTYNGEYLSNYGDIYPSADDGMENIPSSDEHYSLGENYYYNMVDYPIMNQYGAQY